MLRAMSAGPTPLSHLEILREPGFAASRRFRRQLARAILAANGLLLVAAALLAWRRLSGALDGELSRPTLLATALFATTLAAGGRVVWRKMFPMAESRSEQLLDQFVGWAGSAAVILTALGCCYPGDRNSDWLIWLPLIIADQFWRQTFFDNGQPGRLFDEALPTNRAATAHHDTLVSQPSVLVAAADDGPLQQLFRVRLPTGDEAIYGTLRADFGPQQRNATLHVGFCPPLEGPPIIEADACQRADVRIKVVQAVAHGVRLDVRLASPAPASQRIQIDMAARPGEHFDNRVGA